MENLSTTSNNNGDGDIAIEEEKENQDHFFSTLHSYPFQTDVEFRKGLSVILRHPDRSATDAEVNSENDLVLQAKCFYFSR